MLLVSYHTTDGSNPGRSLPGGSTKLVGAAAATVTMSPWDYLLVSVQAPLAAGTWDPWLAAATLSLNASLEAFLLRFLGRLVDNSPIGQDGSSGRADSKHGQQ